MKTLYIALLIGVVLGIFSCQENKGNSPSGIVETDTSSSMSQVSYDSVMFKDAISRENERYEKIFVPILDTVWQQDTAQLLQELDDFYGLLNPAKGSISNFYLAPLNGYNDTVFVIEYTIPMDSSCENYPYQQQFIFNRDGQLLHTDQAMAIQFIKVWETELPVLMTLNVDCKGLGKHHFYKYVNGRLIDIFNVFLGGEDTPYTYLNLVDSVYYDPFELTLKTKDLDKDGYNDLSFFGKKITVKDEKGRKYSSWKPYKKEQIEYSFIYKPTKGLFFLKQ